MFLQIKHDWVSAAFASKDKFYVYVLARLPDTVFMSKELMGC